MTTDIHTTDQELEDLMAELEAQNEEMAKTVAATAPVAPKAEPKPVVAATPAPVIKPEPKRPPEPVEPPPVVQDDAAFLESALAELEEVTNPTPKPAKLPAQAIEILEKNGTPLPWEDDPKPEAFVPKVPDFVKKLVKPKPEPVEFEDVPDLDALAEEARLLREKEAIAAAAKPTERVLPGGGLVDVASAPAQHASVKVEPPRPTEAQAAGGLSHYVDVDQFRLDTRVTEATLDTCMIEQNGLRAYYGANAARAEAQAARLKAKFEVIEATLFDQHRKTFAASGEKATVQMVESAVKMDARWLKGKNMVIESETIAAINKGLVESLKDRRDMIIQLGADRRDEYKGQARVLAEQNDREDLRNRALRAGQARA